MAIRREPTYLSTDVWRALRLISKSKSVPEENRIVTPDEIADNLLRMAIGNDYPQIFDHFKTIDKLDKKLIEEIASKKSE